MDIAVAYIYADDSLLIAGNEDILSLVEYFCGAV